MQSAQLKPILNSSLPPRFRQIRLELAREPGYPEGDKKFSYVIVAPLASDGQIDPALWRQHREACRIARQRPGQEDQVGRLVHRPGGTWAFHYDSVASMPDELGYHFADEHFAAGEYVSINENGTMHTYRVASVTRL